ncbi:MAG: hypothetical protein M3298_00640 [Thermoproteota archaeon]|nr:hypothetical protein [Thermoproteota archaeon]
MTPKATATTALIFTIFALVGGAASSAEIISKPLAYAQLSEIGDTVDDTLETVGIEKEEEEEEEVDSSIEQQPMDQSVGQEAVDQSEHSNGNSNNIQVQSGLEDKDISQEIVNNNDSAESSSEFGYTKGKYASFTSSTTSNGAEGVNEQDADNGGELNQKEDQRVDQDDTSIFTDDTADPSPANVATPIAVPVNVQVGEGAVQEEP